MSDALANYHEFCQLGSLAFAEYRQKGRSPHWNDRVIKATRSRWRAIRLPRRGQIPQFRDVVPFAQRFYNVRPPVDQPNLESMIPTNDPQLQNMREILTRVKSFFSDGVFKYKKVLGYGGLGMALHFQYDGIRGKRDVVAKVSLRGWEADDIRKEERVTRKVFRAAHCIQMIRPRSVGRPELEDYTSMPPKDDSSSESESSGEESIDEQPAAPVPRAYRSAAQIKERQDRYNARIRRWNEWKDRPKDNAPSRKDYLLLEYAEGGSLENLIEKLIDWASPGGPAAFATIPNTVLWQIWLCLVRACVAMKYPPRKFHPHRPKPPRRPPGSTHTEEEIKNSPELRKDPQNIKYLFDMAHYRARQSTYDNAEGDLIEDIPPESKRWRAKNLVHFDIDPSNVFIGNIERPGGGRIPPPIDRMTDRAQDDREEGEHLLVPRFKLADFGIAHEVKREKRNEYYMGRRWIGKHTFFAPEQFCGDWDNTQPVRNGVDVYKHAIAGSYGSAMNVWGVALTMWSVITHREPHIPPQPQIPPGVTVPDDTPSDMDEFLEEVAPNTPISYCPLLMDEDGPCEYVDPELRRTIYECMYHNPNHRPTVEKLLEQAKRGIQKVFDGETDQYVQAWTYEMLFNASSGVYQAS